MGWCVPCRCRAVSRAVCNAAVVSVLCAVRLCALLYECYVPCCMLCWVCRVVGGAVCRLVCGAVPFCVVCCVRCGVVVFACRSYIVLCAVGVYNSVVCRVLCHAVPCRVTSSGAVPCRAMPCPVFLCGCCCCCCCCCCCYLRHA